MRKLAFCVQFVFQVVNITMGWFLVRACGPPPRHVRRSPVRRL